MKLKLIVVLYLFKPDASYSAVSDVSVI